MLHVWTDVGFGFQVSWSAKVYTEIDILVFLRNLPQKWRPYFMYLAPRHPERAADSRSSLNKSRYGRFTQKVISVSPVPVGHPDVITVIAGRSELSEGRPPFVFKHLYTRERLLDVLFRPRAPSAETVFKKSLLFPVSPVAVTTVRFARNSTT